VPENVIIAEIHRHREEVSRACDLDPAKLIAYYRRRESERQDDGHLLVTLSPPESEASVMREEPPSN
jgi:hypothetical protein